MWILCLKLTMAKYNLDKDLNQFPSPKKGHVFIMWKRNAGVKNIHSKGKKISQILHWTPDTHTLGDRLPNGHLLPLHKVICSFKTWSVKFCIIFFQLKYKQLFHLGQVEFCVSLWKKPLVWVKHMTPASSCSPTHGEK